MNEKLILTQNNYPKILDLNGPWMTVPEVAAYAHVNTQAVFRSIYAKKLRGYKPRKLVLCKKIEVDAWLEGSIMRIGQPIK